MLLEPNQMGSKKDFIQRVERTGGKGLRGDVLWLARIAGGADVVFRIVDTGDGGGNSNSSRSWRDTRDGGRSPRERRKHGMQPAAGRQSRKP